MKFDCIVSNPPYSAEGNKTLYLDFIAASFDRLNERGMSVYLVPSFFYRRTAAQDIDRRIWSLGSMTDYEDLSGRHDFRGAAPDTCIFKFESGNKSRLVRTASGVQSLAYSGGLLCITGGGGSFPLGSVFDVRVGAVSGLDSVFRNSERGIPFVCSSTVYDGKTVRLIHGYDPCLEQFKDRLKARRIAGFNDSNWYKWGREVDFREGEPRIYVNCRTRAEKPFFVSECPRWDGSVLALFPVSRQIDPARAAAVLNGIDWQRLGFRQGGRYIFSQKSLEEALINAKF